MSPNQARSEVIIINLPPELEAAVNEQAQRRGLAVAKLILETLQARFLAKPLPFEPRDEWERRLLEGAMDCGVSIPDGALSSEGLYD